MTGLHPRSRDGPAAGLTHRLERHGTVLLLGLSGRLAAPDAVTVRSLLLRSLGEFPTALVVDLSELQADDESGLLAIPAALRDAAGWPAVPVLVAVPDPRLLARLRALPFNQPPRWFSTRAQALAGAAAASERDRVTTTLGASPQAPAQARAMLQRACQDWRLTELAPAAEVILSELTANAVVHARSAMRVTIQRTPTALLLVVRDADPSPPRQRSLPPAGYPVDNGNGLQLVAAFASDWGTMPTVDGKAVWARIDLGEARDGAIPDQPARIP
ncbi:MAG TPA: ATP-binding protein [Natronosporangium sp.]